MASRFTEVVFDCHDPRELLRLLELGAHRVDVGQRDKPWAVLADPEGNEFCLLGVLP
jgi:hypothetical protein